MRMEIEKYRILIIPQGALDEVYLEESLGLKNDGDTACIKRVNVEGVSRIAHIEITEQSKVK